jgi:hypothetical protein
MASWIVSVLVDRHSLGREWSRQNKLLVDRHSHYGEWSKLIDCWRIMDWYSLKAQIVVSLGKWSMTDIILRHS